MSSFQYFVFHKAGNVDIFVQFLLKLYKKNSQFLFNISLNLSCSEKFLYKNLIKMLQIGVIVVN